MRCFSPLKLLPVYHNLCEAWDMSGLPEKAAIEQNRTIQKKIQKKIPLLPPLWPTAIIESESVLLESFKHLLIWLGCAQTYYSIALTLLTTRVAEECKVYDDLN